MTLHDAPPGHRAGPLLAEDRPTPATLAGLRAHVEQLREALAGHEADTARTRAKMAGLEVWKARAELVKPHPGGRIVAAAAEISGLGVALEAAAVRTLRLEHRIAETAATLADVEARWERLLEEHAEALAARNEGTQLRAISA